MTTAPLNTYWLIPFVLFCLQSLADVARQEAERRKSLDQQGIEAKIIDVVPQNGGGNLAVSSGGSPAPGRTSKESASGRGKTSVDGIRAALQKLDRSIQQTQERLESRRARLQSERWIIPKTGRVSGHSDAGKTQNQLKEEIEELERKLKQLQQERAEIYDRGKKAGFLPGELTGKGIIP
jgi:DNA-binding transcriptional MerR regulator